MGQLEDIQIFIRVIEAGGIGRAAEQLGIAKSAVSRRLSELEKRLGTRLLNRTTRTSSLTEAGREYYERAVKVVDYVSEMNTETAAANAALSGTLRIAVPLSFGLMHLSTAVDLFAKQHPQLRIHIDLSDRQVDIVEEGFDLAFRIADLKDSSIQARRICPMRQVLVASPSYLKLKGIPDTPADLQHHDILKYSGTESPVWKITDPQGQLHQLNLQGKMAANNGDFLQSMAIAGHGIVLLPTFIVWKALASGDLLRVLPECSASNNSAYAVYSKNRYLPQRARLLIEFLVDRFGETPYWDQAL
ncbi:LysR family transcriptional regulator [Motiliproteus sp. MSK22-1]|uniref:LysR family transcriptional regulator n=1 Tax=Motiliproteus sp. MSK22-1 TaxID=1897630 RepID=UPI0009783E80|nr:LysR family transcriptional regulator [Motiliproteus sp. MSK22-1]OMH25791.1 LysR family transcriptional regulator [Motiliproteus sp. MSK22-1]